MVGNRLMAAARVNLKCKFLNFVWENRRLTCKDNGTMAAFENVLVYHIDWFLSWISLIHLVDGLSKREELCKIIKKHFSINDIKY
jgi:hypothetical protein